MAHHVWSVLCYKGSIDKDENQVSLLAVTERLNIHAESEAVKADYEASEAEGRPVFFPANLHFISWWVRSDYEKSETVQARFYIVRPDGKQVPQPEVTVDLMNATGYRLRWVLDVFPFAGFGLYWIVVQSKEGEDWETRARVPLELKLASPRRPADD